MCRKELCKDLCVENELYRIWHKLELDVELKRVKMYKKMYKKYQKCRCTCKSATSKSAMVCEPCTKDVQKLYKLCVV